MTRAHGKKGPVSEAIKNPHIRRCEACISYHIEYSTDLFTFDRRLRACSGSIAWLCVSTVIRSSPPDLVARMHGKPLWLASTAGNRATSAWTCSGCPWANLLCTAKLPKVVSEIVIGFGAGVILNILIITPILIVIDIIIFTILLLLLLLLLLYIWLNQCWFETRKFTETRLLARYKIVPPLAIIYHR